MTDLIGYVNLFSSLFQIGMGLFVFLNDRRDRIKQYYFLSALFLGLWSLSLFFYSNPVLFDATVWLKIVYTFAYCMTLALILFATVYPQKEDKHFKWFFIVNVIYMAIMTIIMWTTNKIVVDVEFVPGEFNSIATMGEWYFLYAIPAFVSAIYIVNYYIKQISVREGIEKRQVQFYVAGGVIMLLPVIIFDFVLPFVLGNTEFYKYSTTGNAIWTLIVGYSIITTRFLDLRVFLGSILITIFKGFFLLIYTVLVVYILIPIWSIDLSVLGVLKLLILAVIGIVILDRIFKYFEEKLLEQFVYVKYHPVTTLTYYASLNSRAVSSNQVIKNLTKIIAESFNAEFSSILLFDSKGEVLANEILGSTDILMRDLVTALKIWRGLNSNRVLVLSELKKSKRSGKRMIDDKRNDIQDFMEKNSIEIMFSIIEDNNFEAVVMIGEKKDRTSYTISDIEFLDGIIQNTHMALIRSYLYSELEILNNSLQQRVSEQTFELQKQVKELEEARRKEADMIDIMGHELRTPMSVVKLNTDLLSNFIDKVHHGRDEFKKYLSRIKESVDTEIKLINTLLSTAKLEGDKIELNPERVDIVEQIKMSLHVHEKEAKEKGISIETSLERGDTAVYADHARTVEVLNNLISNAIKYTEEGTVTVEAAREGNVVRVSIIDTGYGIAKEDIPKLGTKFYRTRNYLNNPKDGKDVSIVRPGGTGLGLYVSFNLVRKMGGQMHVESEVGKGSNFTFTLPIYDNQDGGGPKELSSKDMFARLGLKE